MICKKKKNWKQLEKNRFIGGFKIFFSDDNVDWENIITIILRFFCKLVPSLSFCTKFNSTSNKQHQPQNLSNDNKNHNYKNLINEIIIFFNENNLEDIIYPKNSKIKSVNEVNFEIIQSNIDNYFNAFYQIFSNNNFEVPTLIGILLENIDGVHLKKNVKNLENL